MHRIDGIQKSAWFGSYCFEIYLLLILCLVQNHAGAVAAALDNPCLGSNALLNLVDRPNASDSPCTVPERKMMVETGIEYQQLLHAAHAQVNLPEAEFRFGLPKQNELFLLAPNYIHQSIAPKAGFTQTIIGLKHMLGYTDKWVAAIEGAANLSDGSDAFGDQRFGAVFNGIASYTINDKWTATFMLGGSRLSAARLDGGQYYNSINPDVVLTYAPVDKVNIYGEFYGQSQTGPNEGSGFNIDFGVLYLWDPNLAIDVSVAQRLQGGLGGYERYCGAGFTLML